MKPRTCCLAGFLALVVIVCSPLFAQDLNLGNIHLSLGDIDKSIEHNTRAVEIKPDFGMAHNNLAVALFHSGNLEAAGKHAKEALSLGYSVHPDFLKQIGVG